MDFLFGGFVVLAILGIVAIWRVREFSYKLRELVEIHGNCAPHAILLMDFYRGSEELRERLNLAGDLYKKLKQVDPRPIKIINVIGKLHGETRPIAFSNKDALVARGVPPEDVVVYLGKNENGAADTLPAFLWQRPDYLIGRFFMRLLVFFDPYGINPLSALIRFRRRYMNNTI